MSKLQLTYSVLLSIMVLVGCQQEEIDQGEHTAFNITSDHSDATYDIQVRLPIDYDASDSYDTIYILDSNWYFDHVSEEIARLGGSSTKQAVIVVGVGEGNPRTTDYMPTVTSQGEGGAENFSRFLEEELIPYMEDNYSADTTRSSRGILGHSAGGLYAAYAFTNHNQLFGSYLMLSPAVWYDDGITLEYEKENRSQNQAEDQLVFISKGELEATQLFTNMFHKRLENYEHTELAFHKVKGKDHASSAKPAIKEGLSFYYSLKEN